MALNRLVTIVSVPAATATSSTTDRLTLAGRGDIDADGHSDVDDFGWGVRDRSGNYTPAVYADFQRATVVGVSYQSTVTGSRVVQPEVDDIVNLIHPDMNRIVLRWRVTANSSLNQGYAPASIGFPVELVAGSFNAQYGQVAVDAAGSLRMGTGTTETTPGPKVRRRVWARIRDSISVAGIVLDQAETAEARTEEAVAIVRYYPDGAVGLTLEDDIGRNWTISGSVVSQDGTAITHNLERVVRLEDPS